MNQNTMPAPGFILDFYVNASPGKVIELLTDTELITEWSGAESLVEKRIGGKVVLFDGWVEGNLVTLTDTEVSYTWKPSNWPEEISASQVHFTLEPKGRGTVVTLEHTRFPNSKEMEDHKNGWSSQFFDLLEKFLQK